MSKYGKDPKTKALMSDLKTKTNQTKEYAYTLNKENGEVKETAYIGEDNGLHDLYIDNAPVNAYIHSHDVGALSIFFS
ncbi:hypothetical protein FNJ88_12100 [Chryseobacterium sp. SNU WT5]|uniref:hypothetical protein n=1 Tax=Chryseobacterium sp. SNU WT5 TaxID=2594269 RepID=UPI00117DE386|nr:hypothetical protein [Chryseobacterium sp. SNU WT5]QDP86253.1 hypothetical protein FNJ88_12100 [Chryseobacterium sp. SNU WT5]